MLLRRLLLVLGLLLAPAIANAQTYQARSRVTTGSPPQPYLLNNVAANAAAGSRTVTIETAGYVHVTWQVNLTRATATAITVTCTASEDGGATYANIPGMNTDGTTGTLKPFTWRYIGADPSGALVGNDSTIIKMDVSDYDWIACIFSATGGGGSDLLRVSAMKGIP